MRSQGIDDMASKPLSRRRKALTLVPVALLSGAWTASLAGLGSATAVGDKVNDDRLPDGTGVPTQAIQAPANLPKAGVIAPGVPSGSADSVVDGASTTGIPSAALSAYQRAAQIIDSADKTCNIPWELVAAIGRVESDHGRYGGNVLSAKGVSTPGIYGIALDGTDGTQAVQDTDGGKLDRDTQWDRAVGPMQFIPSTWQVVKVDADGDGKRNPQDIDDASLATAVYLCSGNENLGKNAGQRKAVYRYNHSQSYVDLVLRLMKAYMSGDYTAVPNDASGGQVLGEDPSTPMTGIRQRATKKYHNSVRFGSNGDGGGSGSGGSSGSSGGSTSGGGNSNGGGNGGSSGGGASNGGGSDNGGGGGGVSVPKPSRGPGSGGDTDPVKPVVDTIKSVTEGAAYCRSLVNGLTTDAANKCGQRILGKTKAQAAALVPNTLVATLKWLGLGGLLGKDGGLLG